MSETIERIAEIAAEQLQDCYEYHKAGPNFDFTAGQQIVEAAITKATAPLRQRVAELDKPHDTVWPGEEDAERIWKITGGVGPDDGRMWLTPRMARVAAKAAAAMAQQKEGVK